MTPTTTEAQQTDAELSLHRHQFKIVKEDVVYSRYINVYNRVVEVSHENSQPLLCIMTPCGIMFGLHVTCKLVELNRCGVRLQILHGCQLFCISFAAGLQT